MLVVTRENPNPLVRSLLPCLLATSVACTGGLRSGDDGLGDEPSIEQIEQAVREGCAPPSFAGKIARAGTDQVDLLVVVDQSGSMREELDNLSRELPKVAKALTSGDLDGDGQADILPVQSLRVGITSNDLGSLVSIPTCEGVGGDRGSLFKAPDGKAYFEYQAGAPDDSFETLSALFAQLGTDGCGFEQPFEATLAALTGEAAFSDVSDAFPAPEPSDFLRETSVLAVLLVTDEDDCSALPPQEIYNLSTEDPRFFTETGERQGLNVRCALHGDDPTILRSVDDFVTRLKALRADIPSRVVFGAFAGAPAGTQKTPSELLEDPLMEIRVEGPVETSTSMVAAACETERGRAAPARRIVQAAAAFGAQGIVQSICDQDLAAPLQRTMLALAQSFEPLPGCE